MLCLLGICFSTVAFSQTSVIAVKSHSGDLSEIPNSTDHFGMVAPRPVYDTLIKLEGTCVIQIGSREYSGRFRDTICDHWYYKQHNFSEKKIQEFHGDHVVLINFQKDSSIDTGNDSPSFRSTRRNSSELIFLLLVLIGLGSYVALQIGRAHV